MKFYCVRWYDESMPENRGGMYFRSKREARKFMSELDEDEYSPQSCHCGDHLAINQHCPECHWTHTPYPNGEPEMEEIDLIGPLKDKLFRALKHQIVPMLLVVLALASTAQAQLPWDWTDTTGKFKVRASLQNVSETAVTLRKADGSYVSVPFSRLSRESLYVVIRTLRIPAKRMRPEKKDDGKDKPYRPPEPLLPIPFGGVPIAEKDMPAGLALCTRCGFYHLDVPKIARDMKSYSSSYRYGCPYCDATAPRLLGTPDGLRSDRLDRRTKAPPRPSSRSSR